MKKGLGSVSTPTASEIAKKHGVSLGYITKQIIKGVKVEREHTKSAKEANEIARDHLGERPDYYTKLHKMEKTKVKLNELGEYDNKGGSEVVGDLTGSSRKVMKVDEIRLHKVPEKVKTKTRKAIAVGMTAANLATGADIYDRASRGVGSPVRDVAAAASGLPGKVGYAAMGTNYTIKGFDKAREHLRAKMRKKMEEQKDIVPANTAERGIYESDPMKDAEDKIKNAFTVDKVKGMFKRVDKERDKDPKWNAYKKRKQQSMKEEQIDEISAELVGKVSNARFFRGETPSKTLTRAINKKFIESGKKDKGKVNKDKKNIKEDNAVDMDRAMAAFRKKETGSYEGNYGAKSKSSSASGAYQFIDKTWRGVTKQLGVGTEYKHAKDAPKEVQDKVMRGELDRNVKKYGSLEKAVNVHYTGNPEGRMSRKAMAANRGQVSSKYYSDFQKNMTGYQKPDTPSTTQVAKSSTPTTAPTPSTPKSTQVAKAPEPSLGSKVASALGLKSAAAKPVETPKVTTPTTPTPETPKASDSFKVSYAPEPSSSTSYTVKKGDTLSGIAKAYHTDVGSLAKSSNISDPNKIQPGQNININKSSDSDDEKNKTVKEELMDTKELIHEAIGNIMEENLHEMKDNFFAVLQEKAIEKLEERKKVIAANYFSQ